MTMQMQAIANQSVNEQQSLVLVRNLIRTSISSIAYIRHIFPEDCFSDRLLSGLSVKTLLPSSSESKLVMQWLEQGVFDALEKKYCGQVEEPCIWDIFRSTKRVYIDRMLQILHFIQLRQTYRSGCQRKRQCGRQKKWEMHKKRIQPDDDERWDKTSNQCNDTHFNIFQANFAIDEQKNQNEVEVEKQEQQENEDQNINKADQAKEKMKKIEEEPKKSKNKDKTEEAMKAQKRKRFDEEQEDLNQNVTLNKKNEKLIEKDELKNINISENNKEFDKKNSELISKIEIKQETSESNKGKKRKRFDEEHEQEQEQQEKILEQKQTTPQKQITPQNQVPHIVLPAPCNHNSQLKSDQIENIQNSPISSPNLLEISNQQFAFVQADRKEEKIENDEKNGSNSKKQNEKTNSIQLELEKEDPNKQHQQQQPILKASQNAPIVADIEDLESTQKDTETESDSLVDPSECLSHTDHSGSRSGLEVPSTQSIMQMSLSSQLNSASPGCIVTQTEMHGIYHHNSQSQQSSSSSSYMNTEQIAAAIQADTCDIQQQQQTESQSEQQQQTFREGNVIKCSVICDPVLQCGQLQQQLIQQCLQHPIRSSLPIVSYSFSSGQSSATAAALAALAPQKRNSNSNARTGYGRFMRMSEE